MAVRRGKLALGSYSNWQPSEIRALTVKEFEAYLDLIPKHKAG